MPDVFRIQALKPKLLQVDNIRNEILKELRGEGNDLKAEFEKTTAGWDGDKPSFEPKVVLNSREAGVSVGPTGNEKGVNKWGWLNDGTPIRWAVMSNDWKSKTKPGNLGSGGGSGRVVIAGRRAMTQRNIQPRPGIKARGWTKTIGRQNTRRFPNRITMAIRRAKKF
jgi:hypothetical protein